jgi:hypothetical protein
MNVIEKQSSYEPRIGVWGADHAPVERTGTAKAAHQLSTLALRQWERAITGTIALPAAAALGTAASVLYAVALIERAFETIESAVSEIGRNIARDEDGRALDRRDNRVPEARA